jgi:Flp pilus assembly protein TadG
LRPEFVVRLRLLNIFRSFGGFSGGVCSRLLANRQGNIALTFGLVAMPMLLGVGISIDYVRAYNTRVKMQSDLDAALIASVKKVDTLNDDQIKQEVAKWFAAQANDNQTSYRLLLDSMVISKTNKSIQAVATGVMPTTFLGLANIPSINVSVVTTVAGPASSYLNVYIVLDKSASMMLLATAAGQNAMRSLTQSQHPNGTCVLACHSVEVGPWTYNGSSYATNYTLARAMGYDLRADVAVRAAKKVLDMVNASDPTHSHIKVGLYTIGSDASEVLPPTLSTNDALKELNDDSSGLTAATSEDTTRFDVSLPSLANKVGKGGDGSSASEPKKLVLLLTDGVQSERPWVMNQQGLNALTSPLNSAWCDSIKREKADKVDLGVLYTEYLPMTWDAGYSRTLNLSMKSSDFKSQWKGKIPKNVDDSITRTDFIPISLQSCASDPALYLSASAPDKIESGLSSLFDTYLSSVRLTQ